MFGQLFDPENSFWSLLGRMVDFVGLGLFWLLLCLPVVTIIPSTSALYYTVVKNFRKGQDKPFLIFWDAFKSNVKQGIGVTLICLPFAVVIFLGYLVMIDYNNSNIGMVMYMAYYVVMLVGFGYLCWIAAIMARFEMKTKRLFYLSFVLALRHLPSTVVMMVMNWVLLFVTLQYWWPVFATPVLAALLTSFLLERIFPKYLTEEEIEVFEAKSPDLVEKEMVRADAKEKQQKKKQDRKEKRERDKLDWEARRDWEKRKEETQKQEKRSSRGK